MRPTAVDIRAYNVGFGDCFLVIFSYGKKDKRSVLIDFGSTGRAKTSPASVMLNVAQDIEATVKKECGGVLHGVVATHRHKDHISGFAGKSGQLIEALKPKVVVQPWTEDPQAKRNAKSAASLTGRAAPKSLAAIQTQYLQSLADMNAFNAAALAAVAPRLGKTTEGKLRFLADDNLANREAIERLARMGKTGAADYVRAGDKTRLEKQLPGVKIHVLGPPDLTQTETILKQRASDKEEFWQFMQFWSMHAGSSVGSKAGRLFPNAEIVKTRPAGTRWFIDRANRQLGHQLLGIVRVLDKVMNNTSVILLFETGDKKLLFPGDAQIENWAYALSEPKELPGIRKLLAEVDLYKVGHHGSRNATPKTLWAGFKRRNKSEKKRNRLQSVVSTMKGKHGTEAKRTEVPRESLVEALRADTDFHSTEDLTAKTPFATLHIDIR
jgi:L-ascorbate metabolism protein UlaG (beta-lactamase superfamily)